MEILKEYKKTIDTLVPDILGLLSESNNLCKRGEDGASIINSLSIGLVSRIENSLVRETKSRPPNTLYASELGTTCTRKLWYTLHSPEFGEKLIPQTKLKFLYGDIIEELAISLAELSGHKVEGKQQLVEYRLHGWSIRGRLDAIIDGNIVDIKSASSRSFDKFVAGLRDSTDPFGYRAQLSLYTEALIHKEGYFLVIDKQHGKIHLSKSSSIPIKNLFSEQRAKELESSKLPPRFYKDVQVSVSGNRAIPTPCSYCPFKLECWKDANEGRGLRLFIYSHKPVYLTKVLREPNVKEIKL